MHPRLWQHLLVLILLSGAVVHADAEMVAIPAGPFLMGSAEGEPDERPPHEVQLAAFQIDRYEVTQDQYARCVTARVCTRPKSAKGSKGSKGSKLPVFRVSWSDAMKYCKWAGKRLPTEAEWERAARGTDGRRFPWGAKVHCKNANFGNYKGAGLCAGKNPGKIMAVGSRPRGASPAGVQDMAGNVWEWVADLHRPYPWRKRSDPLGQGAGKKQKRPWRVIRGGSCCSYFAMPTTTNRLSFPADYTDFDIGFRCAR